MKDNNQILAQRGQVIDAMRKLLNKCERESRDLDSGEQLEYAKLNAKQELLAEEAGIRLPAFSATNRGERLAAIEAHAEQPVDTVRGLSPRGSRHEPESEAGVLLDHRTLKAGAQAISNKLGVRHDAERAVSLADFVRGVAKMQTRVQNALSVGTDSTGGYSVPTVLMPGILEALVPASSLLTAGAGIVSLEDRPDGAKSYNVAAVDSLPTAGWRSEAGAIAESDPTFKSIQMVPRSLSFRFKVSRELLMDSENIESALRTVIAQTFAKELDRVGLRGSGTAPEPRGLLNMVGIQSVTNGTDGATPTNYSDFIEAWQAIVTDNAPAPTAAIMHPRDMATYAGLADTTGQPLVRPSLLGDMRFIQTSQIPVDLTVGTSTDCSEIYVGDFTQLRYYMRESLSIQLLNELYAETGQVGFIAHARVDVAALYPAAFAVVTGVRA